MVEDLFARVLDTTKKKKERKRKDLP